MIHKPWQLTAPYRFAPQCYFSQSFPACFLLLLVIKKKHGGFETMNFASIFFPDCLSRRAASVPSFEFCLLGPPPPTCLRGAAAAAANDKSRRGRHRRRCCSLLRNPCRRRRLWRKGAAGWADQEPSVHQHLLIHPRRKTDLHDHTFPSHIFFLKKPFTFSFRQLLGMWIVGARLVTCSL